MEKMIILLLSSYPRKPSSRMRMDTKPTTTRERRFQKKIKKIVDFKEYDKIIEKLLTAYVKKRKNFHVLDCISRAEWGVLLDVLNMGFDIGITRRGMVYYDLAVYLASAKNPEDSKWMMSQRGEPEVSISGDGSTEPNLDSIVKSLKKYLQQFERELVILDAGIGDCGLWLKFFSENHDFIDKIKLVGVDIALEAITKNPLSKVAKLKELLPPGNLVLIKGDSANQMFLNQLIKEHNPEFVFARTLLQHMTLPSIRSFLEVVSTSGAKFISTDFPKTDHSLIEIMPFGCIYRNLTELFNSAKISNFRITDTLEDSQSYMTVVKFED